MRYPAVEVKRSIVDSAPIIQLLWLRQCLFSQIMEGANLTHGGFYSYFKSKSDLYSEVLGCFFTDPHWDASLNR